MQVPILNEEIKISSEALCVVHGIKRLDPELALPPSIQPTVTNSAQENQQDPNATPETSASPSVPDVTPVVAVAEPLYIYDKYSQE